MRQGYDEYFYKKLSASGSVGDSGKAVALYGYMHKSGGTAGNPTFYDGTSTSGTAVFDATGTINTTVVQALPAAITFPSGLYVNIDANTTYVTAIYRQILT